MFEIILEVPHKQTRVKDSFVPFLSGACRVRDHHQVVDAFQKEAYLLYYSTVHHRVPCSHLDDLGVFQVPVIAAVGIHGAVEGVQ